MFLIEIYSKKMKQEKSKNIQSTEEEEEKRKIQFIGK